MIDRLRVLQNAHLRSADGRQTRVDSQLSASDNVQLICRTDNGTYAHLRKMKYVIEILVLLAICGCTTMIEQPGELPSLSGAAQTERYAALQSALEHNVSGHARLWRSSPGSSGSVAPLETRFSSTDGWCRDYEELIADGPRRYRLVGVACRNRGPRWLVLDVRPFIETPVRASAR